MKILISKKTGIYYYYKEVGDYHCKEGVIKEDDLKSGNMIAVSNTGREFLVSDANDYDYSTRLKVGPQLITKKDLGYILARSGINKNSVVIEAGSGSGAATSFFAGIVAEVKSFDVREDHIAIVQRNLNYLNLKNVNLKFADITDEIENENPSSTDLLFLDMPDCHRVLEKDLKTVKSGHYVICYVPSISQIQDITKVVSERSDLYLEEISEIILRHWRVWEKVARPNHRKDIDHTAFLVFIRKI